jgi:hypothetical protein
MHDCKPYIYVLNSKTKYSLHNEVSISQECDANVVAQHDQVSATRSRCTLFTALVPGLQHQHTVVQSTLNKLTQRVPTRHIDPVKMLVGVLPALKHNFAQIQKLVANRKDLYEVRKHLPIRIVDRENLQR